MYKQKYLKYKQKYFELKNQQAGGVILPDLYYIFYNEEQSSCVISQYKNGEKLPLFSEFNKIFGPATYALKNKSTNLSLANLIGTVYNELLVKNLDVGKYISQINNKFKSVIGKDLSKEDIEFMISNANIKLDTNLIIDNKKQSTFNVYKILNKENFFNKENPNFKNIINKINSIGLLQVNSVLVVDVGVKDNFFVDYYHFNGLNNNIVESLSVKHLRSNIHFNSSSLSPINDTLNPLSTRNMAINSISGTSSNDSSIIGLLILIVVGLFITAIYGTYNTGKSAYLFYNERNNCKYPKKK